MSSPGSFRLWHELWWILPVLAGICPLMGCMNHYAIYPRHPSPAIAIWHDETIRGRMKLRFEWACPQGEGPFPTLVVHPAAGVLAEDLRGVIFDLAAHGYLAVSVDYQRLLGARFRKTLFPWREEEDAGAAIGVVRSHPLVDRRRIGLLGFSQGGVFSLLIGAYAGEVQGIVAYYPVTDFESWMSDPSYNWGRRLIFRFIRGHFMRQSGATDAKQFREILSRASPLQQAERITAPVLLVHGTKDTSAPVSQSRRLAARLAELGREVKLVEIQGARHVFNFSSGQEAQGREAWTVTLLWLERHVKNTSKSADPTATGSNECGPAF